MKTMILTQMVQMIALVTCIMVTGDGLWVGGFGERMKDYDEVRLSEKPHYLDGEETCVRKTKEKERG